MFENVGDSTFIVQLVVAFGAGVVSFISPCVLPLLPGYLSMMSGYSAAQLDEGTVSSRRMVRVVLLFILGFTVIFAALGAAATGLGQLLRSNLPALTRVSGVLILVFGLLMVGMAISNRGVFGYFNQERRLHVRPSRLGGWAPPVMGAAFAFGWTPCIGAVLGAIFTTASIQKTVGQGILLLIIYSLGLGLPFLLAGVGLFKFFGKLGPYVRTINVFSGGVLALFGVLMVTNNVDTLSRWFVDLFDAIPILEELAEI